MQICGKGSSSPSMANKLGLTMFHLVTQLTLLFEQVYIVLLIQPV